MNFIFIQDHIGALLIDAIVLIYELSEYNYKITN